MCVCERERESLEDGGIYEVVLLQIASSMNFGVLKEPRGALKPLQFVSNILAMVLLVFVCLIFAL